ncbi:MAG TPA: bifunctional DNA primase/polymerase, partial [Cellulomonas sp.]|nr:bifunctional DNA primase/polymerase [Cellulomonas sp.]
MQPAQAAVALVGSRVVQVQAARRCQDGSDPAVLTPSGGLHLHYPGTDQRNGSLRGLHIDFRGAGGYVLLPPSLGQTKAYSRRYETYRTR